jgi:hypothetical protein
MRFVVVGLVLFVSLMIYLTRRPPPPPGRAAAARAAAKAAAATPAPLPLRPDIQKICDQNGVILVNCVEGVQRDIVDIWVKSRDRNAINYILDDMRQPPRGNGLMKDLINYDDPKRYWITIENSEQMHNAHHELRAYR